ncbi:MAG TPA: ferredoxin [Solirubrobacteraceae bacterium]|jgi:ferredoxin|nr:ferredoxin [Solirubrobacteraceae bacterium]
MHVEIDPIKCEAHGLCAELLPERITLDEWGYPLIDQTPVPAALEDLARRAVNACPTLALRLQASQHVNRNTTARRSAERSAAAARSGAGDQPYQLYTQRRGRG